MRSTLLSVAAAALAGTSMASPMPADNGLAPIYTPPAPPAIADGVISQAGLGGSNSHLIPDSYIVVLKKGLRDQHHAEHMNKVQELWTAERGRMQKRGMSWEAIYKGLHHMYDIGKGGFRGYSVHIPESMLHRIRSLPEVAYVERDSVVTINDPHFSKTTVPAVTSGDSFSAKDIETEFGAPWGLARLSHRDRLRFGSFNVYDYDASAGTGVDVYVIDTGVYIEHNELEGRARWGKTIPSDADVDGNGHGSHVAGTIASRAYGVAKNATIIAVKVLGSGGSGTMADVVAGVVWAADSADKVATAEAKKKDSNHKGSVANMSLGGGKSQALDDAVNQAVETGLHFAVAAGNDNRDACTFSPAAAPNPITVGASTIQDEPAYFSNHGPCVDIFAPGLNIKSIWNNGPDSINTISGTSMASPHIAGLVAYFLGLSPEKFDIAAFVADESEEETGPSTQYAWAKNGQLVFDRLRQTFGLGGSSRSMGAQGELLSPKELKKLMVKLSTKDILTGLPARTVNALAFNNVTS